MSITKATSNVIAPILATGSTTARSLPDRFADVANVLDFGADPTGVVDSYLAIQHAIDSLSSGGGKIVVPTGTYKVGTKPTGGFKSIHWDISPNAVFTGAATNQSGGFPYIYTNPGNVAAGPWVFSNSQQAPTFSQAAVNAATFEIVSPSGPTTGQYVGLYAGATSYNTSSTVNTWAFNALVFAPSVTTGVFYGGEFDVNVNSLSAITVGVLATGGGTQIADVGIKVDRTYDTLASSPWFYGHEVRASKYSILIRVDSAFTSGICFDNTNTGSGNNIFSSVLFSGRQVGNGTDTIIVQRATDTSSTGSFFKAVNNANNTNLAYIDTNGVVYGRSGLFTLGFIRVTSADTLTNYFEATATSLSSRVVQISTSYANDTAAAAGGVALGQFYRNGSVVQIRVT
jgi:Pectate lyase superfamily protein